MRHTAVSRLHLRAPTHLTALPNLPSLSTKSLFPSSRLENRGRGGTALLFKSSSSNISRWCSRLKLLILSWSSRRTSRSSFPIPASSSLESWTLVRARIKILAKSWDDRYHPSLHLEQWWCSRTDSMVCLSEPFQSLIQSHGWMTWIRSDKSRHDVFERLWGLWGLLFARVLHTLRWRITKLLS